MKRGLVLLAMAVALIAVHAQNSVVERQENEAKWAKRTGLSSSTIHRLWRSISHFADEQDDDSQIEMLDANSLADRNQLLLVTSAGEPRCLTLAVFSKASGFMKVWSADSTPEGHGFCDNLGLLARFTVTERGIEVVVPVERHSPRASHADVEHWVYHWTGKTYSPGEKSMQLEYIPK
jgi:hypothetical protein